MKVYLSVFTAFFGLSLSGCGASGQNPTNAARATIDYIRAHGFPKLADLLPALPAQLARIPGVSTSETGLPDLPRATANANFDSSEAISALVTEAQGLAAQGFSESRRLEASLQNLVAPAYDLLGRADLFAADQADTTTSLPAGMAALGAGSASGESLFDNLISNVSYAVDIGGANGLPKYLVLGTEGGAVKISGVWADGSAYATGFAATLRLNELNDFALTMTLAPNMLSGLLASWSANKCGDDVWQLSAGAAPSGEHNLAITARECASTRDAVSQLALGRTGSDGPWKLTGGFAQTFDDADPDSLRGFLGKRQGFVMQAAAASDASKLAAAAAVLSEADFAQPTQDKIDQFGVGAILARFFQVKYFDKQEQKAANGSILTESGNVAYWMCENDIVAPVVQQNVANSRQLCQGSSLDVETILTSLTSLRQEVASVPLAPSSVKDKIDSLLAVLSIRNTLFVGSSGDLAYKTAPDAAFATLDDARRDALPPAVGTTAWLGGAQASLPRLTQAQIPDSAYKALTGGLSGFLKDKCRSMTQAAQAQAGKADTSGSECG